MALLVVWFALVAPNQFSDLTPLRLVRIPLEGLAIVAVGLVLPPRPRRAVAWLLGAVLGLAVVLKALDMGFFAVLDRPFDPLNDWYYLAPGVGVLGDSIGRAAALLVVIAAVLLLLGALSLVPLAVVRVIGAVAGHRWASLRVVLPLIVIWVVLSLSGLHTAGAPVASAATSGLLYGQASQLRADLADRTEFGHAIAVDAFRGTPDDQLLTGLRGKDVVLAFVESYGRVAVQGSTFSPGIDALLDAGTTRLHAAGFSARSAFLTSPTFGAASWLAHSTLQSGLWTDSQQRYDQLLTHRRLTLTDAFGRAGWRTVFDVPANTRDWPEGRAFYGFDKLYDSRNVGYRGPQFSYATMPDQYVLAAFRRLELAERDRRPVMAELDLVSSHHPWAPLPRPVAWKDVGDGSVFAGMPDQGDSPDTVLRDPDKVRAAYGQSIEYTLDTLVSYVETFPDPDLVLIVLGDHQPHEYITGDRPGHDVPITIIAHDRDVMARVAPWGWQNGMRPGADAPVWRMDAFRDRFLTAYGPP